MDSEYIENPGHVSARKRSKPKMNDARRLALDLKAAVELATLKVAGLADGGTSNLDSVKVYVPRRSAAYEAELEAAGFRATTERGGAYNVVSGSRVGQGQRSTTFCELVVEFLRERDHEAHVAYLMD